MIPLLWNLWAINWVVLWLSTSTLGFGLAVQRFYGQTIKEYGNTHKRLAKYANGWLVYADGDYLSIGWFALFCLLPPVAAFHIVVGMASKMTDNLTLIQRGIEKLNGGTP